MLKINIVVLLFFFNFVMIFIIIDLNVYQPTQQTPSWIAQPVAVAVAVAVAIIPSSTIGRWIWY
jgi:hypothetical protein